MTELQEKLETALRAYSSPVDFAKAHNLNNGSVYHVLNGGYSRSVARVLGVRREQVDRMAARLTPEEGAIIRAWLARGGFESITEFWQDLANGIKKGRTISITVYQADITDVISPHN